MLAFAFFSWWYGAGWTGVARHIRTSLAGVSHTFSVPILLRTLFAPWRRIISYPGAGLDAKLRAVGDNIVSRAVGFAVRIIVLVTALVLCAIAFVVGIIGLVAWPLVPVATVVFIVKGIVG